MKPWREVAVPQRDVMQGTFTQSSFAVNLPEVVKGGGAEEYRDAKKFFQCTYMTDSLSKLLGMVVSRLAGRGSESVVNLQTNFGGGKTHTLLAVWHLARGGAAAKDYEGVARVMSAAGVTEIPNAKVAVVDGNDKGVNQTCMEDGVELRTLWGRIAWQIGGIEAYRTIEPSDKAGTAPGTEAMTEIFRKAGPCVILLDELVSWYRNILDAKETPIAGGYANNISFLQQLTESVERSPNAMLLVSMPLSRRELGGSSGEAAEADIKKFVTRKTFVWQSGTQEEGYEIVKRRLFTPIADVGAVRETVAAYVAMYRAGDDFPQDVKDADYEARLEKCYPIHPELFDRLYNDWSTLESFQRTRGVLQFMAIVIRELYKNDNHDPMIMPGALPFAAKEVADRAVHYLNGPWDVVISGEVDGENARAVIEIDSDPRFAPANAAHKAARAIFLGSAPASAGGHVKGLENERMYVGVATPGCELAVFKDVVGRLENNLQYFFAEGTRNWYDTHPNLRREAENIKAHVPDAEALAMVKKQLDDYKGAASGIAGCHVFVDRENVPDENAKGVRVVVLPPSDAWTETARHHAEDAARRYVMWKGENARRLFANRLVFLAPDMSLCGQMFDIAKTMMAWDRIVEEIRHGQRENLDGYQRSQAESKSAAAKMSLKKSVLGCFRHLLVPIQMGNSDIGFEHETVDCEQKKISEAVEAKLEGSDALIMRWGSALLKRHLEQWYLQDGVVEVSAKRVWEDMAKLLYMPRLLGRETLEKAISEGVEGGLFGYAQDKDGGKYVQFAFRQPLFMAYVNDTSLLVEAGAAEAFKRENSSTSSGPGPLPPAPGPGPIPPGPAPAPSPSGQYRGFYGTVQIDKVRGLNHFKTIWEEIVNQFRTDPSVDFSVKLDISANRSEPFPSNVVRAVKENAAQLGMDAAFEESRID